MMNICTFWLLMAGLASGLQARDPVLMKMEAEERRDPLVPLGESSAEGVITGSQLVHCDWEYYCPSKTTCCHHPAGQWGCCPLRHAHCCLDGYHCCPAGHHCDRTYSRCLKGDLPYPFFLPKPATMIKAVKKDGNP